MMSLSNDKQMEEVIRWCASVVGPLERISDNSREHPGERTVTCRLHAASRSYYVKMHRDPANWENEVHGYEQWAPAFGGHAPRLVTVRDIEPLALIIGELPGSMLQETALPVQQERAAWRAAGQGLTALHALPAGSFFGACRRDGAPAGPAITEAREYVSACFDGWFERGMRGNFLSQEQVAIIETARGLIPSFAGERPLPCHRDYCPANWLVTGEGKWAGVIDFEFSYWDVRVADFTRYPTWDWISRPDLVEAFFEGYGRSFSAAEEQQRLVGHALYALGAIVWGKENAYYGFAEEGQQALIHLGKIFNSS